MKYYRLLRNNRETGPFSAEDLIQIGFKAYDLIWEEGKSASWRYPSEIPEFKVYAPVVEEQPFDRFYKNPCSAAQAKMPENKVSLKVINEPTVRQDKPRIKIKAECRKIETNVDIQPAAYGESSASQPVSHTQVASVKNISSKPQTASPDWEKMWLDWEQEKKTVSSLKYEDDKELEIETKYSQSLDDLKELYAEKVLKGKQASFSFDKYKSYIAIVIISACVLTLGIWMGVKWSNNDETKSHMQQVEQSIPEESRQLIVQANENSTASNNNAASGSDLSDNVEASKVIIVPDVKNDIVSNQKKTPIRKTSPLAQKVISKPVVSQKSNQVKNIVPPPGAITKGTERKKIFNTATEDQKSASSKMRVAAEKSVNDYISIRNISSPGAAEASYKVENISDITVELVMIDLQYYDVTGRFKKGETVYVRNINPGETVSVKAPSDVTTPTITPKISLISSEAKNLYLIAE